MAPFDRDSAAAAARTALAPLAPAEVREAAANLAVAHQHSEMRLADSQREAVGMARFIQTCVPTKFGVVTSIGMVGFGAGLTGVSRGLLTEGPAMIVNALLGFAAGAVAIGSNQKHPNVCHGASMVLGGVVGAEVSRMAEQGTRLAVGKLSHATQGA